MGKTGMCAAPGWWGLMIVLCCSGIGLEIACLSTPRWFSQGASTTYWEGGLLTPFPSQTYYKDKVCDRDFHRNGYCDMFNNLWIGGLVYFVFELLSLVFFCICAGLYGSLIGKKSDKSGLVTVLLWVAVSGHVIAFGTWAGLGKMKYQGTCVDVYENDGSDPASICRKEGATLGLLTILYVPLIAMLQSLLWYNSREVVEEESKKAEYKVPADNPELSSREQISSDFPSMSAEESN